MKFTKEEIELIELSQRSMNEKLGNCPFSYMVFANEYLCDLCHKWIGTFNKTESHPCDLMDINKVRKRYWRKPYNGTT